MRIFEAGLVGEQRSCISQKRPWRPAASAAQAAGQARGWLERPESGGTPAATQPRDARVSAAQYGHSKSAYSMTSGACGGPADVILGVGAGHRRGAEVPQAASGLPSPSKMRLAPGRSPGEGA